jgi:hypothetical protein
VCFRSADARKGVDLTAGARLTERRGRGGGSEGANQKGKRISREDATDARLDGPTGTVLACGGCVVSGLAGPEAEWAARSAGPK